MADAPASANVQPSQEEQEKFIRRAVELSHQAVKNGNHPFGALLVSAAGDVLLESCNSVNTDHDPTLHAELSLVSAASRKRISLAGATLYTSCEPCMMCCGALFWCGIRRVVFSCSHETLAKHAGDALLMSSRTLLSASGVEIIGPVLESLGEEPHTTYWRSLGGQAEEGKA